MTGEGRKGPVCRGWYLTNAIAFSLSPQSAGTQSVWLKLALGKGWQGYGVKSYPLECDRQVAQTNWTQPQSVALYLVGSCIRGNRTS